MNIGPVHIWLKSVRFNLESLKKKNVCLYFQVCTKLGPLVAFESILSVHGDEVSMLNDMIVVVEDLRNVEFNLILVDKKSKFKLKRNNSQAKSSPAVPMLEYHSFPLPRITGSRSSLKVNNHGLTSILKENSWIYFSRNMYVFNIVSIY